MQKTEQALKLQVFINCKLLSELSIYVSLDKLIF